MSGVTEGADGVTRCSWGAQPEIYRDYHDQEWGRTVHGDDAVFERLALEAFQSGLSWLTILRKREGFRTAFEGFSIERIAEFDGRDVERLLTDPSIVRNRAKILATIRNAGAARALRARHGEGALDRLVWSHRPSVPRDPATPIPNLTPESVALSRVLKREGFAFVGPTTAYAAMQALGVVDDHLPGCASRGGGRRPATSGGFRRS